MGGGSGDVMILDVGHGSGLLSGLAGNETRASIVANSAGVAAGLDDLDSVHQTRLCQLLSIDPSDVLWESGHSPSQASVRSVTEGRTCTLRLQGTESSSLQWPGLTGGATSWREARDVDFVSDGAGLMAHYLCTSGSKVRASQCARWSAV